MASASLALTLTINMTMTDTFHTACYYNLKSTGILN